MGGALLSVLPKGYAGGIYSLSCSTGVVDASGSSVVLELRKELSGQGSSVTGVAGIALSHSAYEGTSRAITEEQHDRFVEHAINKTIAGVDDDWRAWVAKNGMGDLRKASLIATAFSMSFYEALERTVRRHLVPREETFTSAPIPPRLPTGMVAPGQRRREKRRKARERVSG